MKTFIFNMSFTLPPMIEMTEVVQEKNTFYHVSFLHPPACTAPNSVSYKCQETDMKTSIFNMSFTLPPLIEITEVEKDMQMSTFNDAAACRTAPGPMCGRRPT